MKKPKILIHTCCAPCLCYLEKSLKEEYETTALWYNPNIHPFSEYQRRLNTLYSYQVKKDLNVIYINEYNLNKWLIYTKNGWEKQDKLKRCNLCYEVRLIETAEYAKKNNFSFFTTTLLYSKFQFHDDIKQIGEKLEKKFNIKFLYKDFREGWKEGIKISHEADLYRQKYCGCIFSEYKDS